MNSAIDQSRTHSFTVDSEHSALRLSIVAVFLGLWVISFFALNTLIQSEGLNLIAVIVSFLLTAVLTQQIEAGLKKRWPSGRKLQITEQHVTIVGRSGPQQSINAGHQVNVLLWRFKIKRRSRVPKGWFMVACALEQNDVYLPVYTFMSPEQFELLGAPARFTVLLSQKESAPQKGIGQTDLRLAGEQRRLHTAESARWMNGAEMTFDDFSRFIRLLQDQFPQWMPSVFP